MKYIFEKMKVLAIGDPHFMITNIKNVELFMEKLYSLIEKTNFRKEIIGFNSEIFELIGKDHPEDYAAIQTQLIEFLNIHYNKKIFIDALRDRIFDFDHVTLVKLKKMRRSEVVKELTEICKNFAVERNFDTTGLKFPNIYLPCEYYDKVGYCEKNKLIIRDGLDKLIEILADDILNPLKEKYITSGLFTRNIINYFDFESLPFETITITKLN